jgi:hypothetical protein
MFSQSMFKQSAMHYVQPSYYPKLVQRIFRDHRPVRPYRRCPIVDRHHHVAQFDFMQMVSAQGNLEESEDPEDHSHELTQI